MWRRSATLESWIHAARRILKSGGVLTLIWRADGLAEVLAALDRGFGSLAILPVHGDAKRRPFACWFAPSRAAGRRLRILPRLMLNDESGVPNKEVQEILAGKGVLPLAIAVRLLGGCSSFEQQAIAEASPSAVRARK